MSHCEVRAVMFTPHSPEETFLRTVRDPDQTTSVRLLCSAYPDRRHAIVPAVSARHLELLQVGHIIAQFQGTSTKVPVLENRDFSIPKDANGREAVVESIGHHRQSLSSLQAKPFAAEIGVFVEAGSRVPAALLVPVTISIPVPVLIAVPIAIAVAPIAIARYIDR